MTPEAAAAVVESLTPYRERIAPLRGKHDALCQTHAKHLTASYSHEMASKQAGRDADKVQAKVAEHICAEAIGEESDPPEPGAYEALKARETGLAAASVLERERGAAVNLKATTAADDVRAEARAGVEAYRQNAHAEFLLYQQLAFDSAMKLMAADNLINTVLRDPSASGKWFNSPEDLYGPGAIMIERLSRLNWDTWPYSLRPIWAAKNGHPAWKNRAVVGNQVALKMALGLENFS